MVANAPDRAEIADGDAGSVAQSILHQAMEVQYGTLPELDGEILFDQDGMRLTKDAFTFITPRGIGFHYAKGGSVTASLDDQADRQEFELYLWGTVYGAVTWLNGFVPLHASAVEINGQAVAFSAPSGGGKSTIAAAFAAKGHALFSDDTLVLASSPGGMLAIPDGKPMKLWADVLAKIDLQPGDPIAAAPGKYFVRAPVRVTSPQRLDHLVFLDEGRDVELERVEGSEKLNLLSGALYREELHLAQRDHQNHARMMLELAAIPNVWILRRQLDPNSLQASVNLIINQLI